MTPLVLSLFPGIGLLDMAFEEAGFCVVRGPDLLWGGDVRRFHPPAGRFDGVIGGPPCQRWSALANIVRAVHGENSVAEDLIPEFVRIVSAACPQWYLMENVPKAPEPVVRCGCGFFYDNGSVLLNNRWYGEKQNRIRRFSFGANGTDAIAAFRMGTRRNMVAFESIDWEPAVCSTAGGRRASVAIGGSGKPKGNQGESPDARLRNRTLAEECELQGLPAEYLKNAPFTVQGKRKAIGNGVPLPMGRAVAAAVKRAMYPDWQEGAA